MTENDEPTFLTLTAEQAERAGDVLKLSPRLRTFVRMGCVEGRTLDEIAAALELTAEQVVGLRDDLEHDLEATTEGAGESWARMLLAVFRCGTPRDHPPMSATNRYSGIVEEVTLRSPLLNEADLGDRPDDWRVEPVDILGRAAGQAGRWRQKAPGRRRR